MTTTYRLNPQEMTLTFLESIKTLFAGQETVEMTIKPVTELSQSKSQAVMLEWVARNRKNAKIVDTSVDIRALIDQTHDL